MNIFNTVDDIPKLLKLKEFKMKITVVGCGNAFSKKQYNQSILLEENGDNLLIDFGNKVPYGLDALNISINDIKNVYISHLHGDHIGGLEEMAFLRYDWVNRPKKAVENSPKLIGQKDLIDDLWNKSLRGGLESMEGFKATLDTFFNVERVGEFFYWQHWKCSIIQQVHIMSGAIISPSYGLFLEHEIDKSQKKIYFTTDSQHCSPKQIEIFYKNADIIFQDCECVGCNMKEKHLDFYSGVHANYAQLAGWESSNSPRLSTEIKNKMFLSHYQDFVLSNKDYLGNDVNWEEEAKKEGFRGFIKAGQTIKL